jgi:hypothetical protein
MLFYVKLKITNMLKYKLRTYLIILSMILIKTSTLIAQVESEKNSNETKDSLYIEEVENKYKTDKVLHAEPLYIDLIRDLGARKGEKEWNVGIGLTDNNTFDRYEALIEYEWAPMDRLGLEIELPFSFYYPTETNENTPSNKLNSFKVAAQYSFFVSEKLKTSMAIGYIHEFELTEFSNYGKEKLLEGHVYNPFFVAAKRWGNNFHTLLYTGPLIGYHLSDKNLSWNWQMNTNFHYMIPGTRNFIGLELNKEFREQNVFDMVLRPQMRIGVTDNLLIGIVTGIPINKKNERISSFLRLIYEPRHHHKKN